MAQRLVLIDDTNPDIQYSGPWFAAQNVQLDTGNFGPPFQNTLHGVTSDANFSFSFSGSSVTVLGTSLTTNASGSQIPTWECFVDNNSIGWNTVLQYAENSWIFCQNGQLQDGPHVLSVDAKVSQQQTFWFDQIQYLPSSNVSLGQAMLRIDSSDPALQYSSGWQPLDGIANLTQTAGSTLTFPFSGVSLSWVGFTPGHFPLNTSFATYSIDGQTPVNFIVPALTAVGAIELYNQVLFQTGHLSAGQHTLVVTHQGNSGTAPLALEYFVVQDAPSNSTPTTSSGISPASSGVAASASITPSSGSSSSSSNSTTTPLIRPLVGGIVGGLLFLLLIILFLLIRRRNNRGAQALGEKLLLDLSHGSNIVNPFTVPPSNARSTPTLESQNYASGGQSPIPHLTSSKFAQRSQPTDAPTTPSNMISTFPPTGGTSSVSGSALRPPEIISPSSSSLPFTKAREAEPVRSTPRPTTPQSGNARFLRHDDSGVRIPPAEDNIVELPPLYTPG